MRRTVEGLSTWSFVISSRGDIINEFETSRIYAAVSLPSEARERRDRILYVVVGY